jgi:hypothetical protein
MGFLPSGAQLKTVAWTLVAIAAINATGMGDKILNPVGNKFFK